ncbi:hypothetical protein C922_00611 [Plasmodium inui San Antonio 1]|uniref:MI domain-containing protein n=1 Tax=Plasmodium inui San Antonio 1 TaxID=1237626 RepID=W7AB03_9APIC|nr:hypothetical protein C922_00611 [Plasmodium inui San Antonio 1]EUD68920.1 hypothetical protein C922_00611 [Plasmodium inui San Antonio 1]
MSHNNTTVFLFTVQGILASLTCGLCCLIYAYCCNTKNERNRNKRTISKVNGDTYSESGTSAFKKSKVEKEAGSKSVHEDASTHLENGADGASNTKSERNPPRSGNGSGTSHTDNYCKRNGSAKYDRDGTILQKKSIQGNYCHRTDRKMESGLSNQKNAEMDKCNDEEARSSRSNCEGIPLNMRNVNEYKDPSLVGIIPRHNSPPYDGSITEKNRKYENAHNEGAGGSDMRSNWSIERKDKFESNSENMIRLVVPPNRCQARSGEEQNERLAISNDCRNKFNPHSVNSHISPNDYGREDNNRIVKIIQPGEKKILSRNNNMSITVNRVEAKNRAICGLTQKDAAQVAVERADHHAYSRTVLDRQMAYYPNEEVFRVKSETLIRSYPGHGGASRSEQNGMHPNCPEGYAARSNISPEGRTVWNRNCPEAPSGRGRNLPEAHKHFTHRTMNGCEISEDEEEKEKWEHPEHMHNYTPSKCMNFSHDEGSTNRVFVKCEKNVLHSVDKNVPNSREHPSVERNNRVVPVTHKEQTQPGSSEYNTYNKYNDFSMYNTLYRKRKPLHDMSHFNNGKEIRNIIENGRVKEAGTLSYDNDKATCDMHSVSNNAGETTLTIGNVGHYHEEKGFNTRDLHLSNGMSTKLINGERTKSAALYGLAYNQGDNVNRGEGEETSPEGSSTRLRSLTRAQDFASKGRNTDREGETSQGNRNNQGGNNDINNDIRGNHRSKHNNNGENRTGGARYYTRGKSKDSTINRNAHDKVGRNVCSIIHAVEMDTKVPRNSCLHTNKTQGDVNNCTHCSPLDEDKMENRKKKHYYQFPRDYRMGITECLPCKEGTHIFDRNNNCPSVGNCAKQRDNKGKNVYLKKRFPQEHVCLPVCNSKSGCPDCKEKISVNNESFFHSNKFEKNTEVRDINDNFSQNISYNERLFNMTKRLQQGRGDKMVTKSEFSDDIYPLTDDYADYDGVGSSRRGGSRSGNASGVRNRNVSSVQSENVSSVLTRNVGSVQRGNVGSVGSGNVSSLLNGSINSGERCANDEQKGHPNKKGETAIPVPVPNDEAAGGRKRSTKGTKKRGTNSKEETDNQSNTPLLTEEYKRKLRQKEPSEYKSSQDINQIIHAYLQNSKKEYNYRRSDKSDTEINNVTDKCTHEGMDSREDVSPTRKRNKKDSNDNMPYNSCRTKVVGNKKGKNQGHNEVNLAEGERTNSKRSTSPGNKHEKNEQTDQEEKLAEEDTSTHRDPIENKNIRVKREKRDSKVLIKEEKELPSGSQTVRRSARMKSQKYKKKRNSTDSDMHVDTQNEQEELKSESSKKKQNSVNADNQVMEKRKKKMSKTKTMELKIFRDKSALKEKENLRRTNEKYQEIDEYRCASGFVNFIIEHIQKKKDKENFDDLLKYILKLINIYKIKTIDFVESFLLLETISVDIIREYPIEEWILVTFHFLKGNATEQNFNLIIKSLKLNSLVIGNVTASFYMNKKTIRMTEKNMNRILTILSNVVRRRSSRIKTFNRPNPDKKDKKAKEDQQKDELLGSCWQPVEGGAQGK